MGTAALTLRLEETECRAQGVTWGRRGLASTSKCCEPELSWTSIPPPPAPLTCLSPPALPPSVQPQAALSHCRVSLRDSGSLSQKKYRGVQNTLFYLTCITSLPGMASDPPHPPTPSSRTALQRLTAQTGQRPAWHHQPPKRKNKAPRHSRAAPSFSQSS